MTKPTIQFTGPELDILAHALTCFDIANASAIGAARWWSDEDTLWILQKMCKMDCAQGAAVEHIEGGARR